MHRFLNPPNLTIGPILSLLVALAAVNAQEAPQGMTPELIVSLKDVGDVAIHPKGEAVAYVLRTPRDSEDEPGGDFSEIWLVSTRDGKARPLTHKPVQARAPQWSPSGDHLAFLSRRKVYDEDQEIYLLPLEGGEARPLTDSESSVHAFAWSPDGKWIAYTATEPKSEEQKKAEKAGRDGRVVDQNQRHRRLWVVNVTSGEAHRVTEADLSVWSFTWSPDSRTLLLQASEEPTTDASYMFKRIYTVPAKGGEPKLLCQTEGKLGHMAWSPDGTRVAFLGAEDLHDPYAGSVFIAPAEGGAAQNLTPDFRGTATHLAWGDEATVLFSAIEGTKTTFNVLSIDGGEFEPVLSRNLIFDAFSLADDGRSVALEANSAQHPDEVYFGKIGDAAFIRLTHSNPVLNDVLLAPQETIRWKSVDGWEIEGVLWKPLNYERGKRYPLIVQPHGGPESASLDGWQTSYSRWTQLLAARGYCVLLPNYRGSIGRGETFSRGDQDDHGGREFDDILAAIEHLDRQGLIDPDRVGIGGGSYGGYLSAWAATKHSEHFRAAVVFAGIPNWISKSGTSDIPYENALVHWTKFWFEQPELVWDRSPLAHIKNADTPTLIAHGKKDKRVPVSQGWELYRGLKHMDVPVEFVIYPRAAHGLRERAHKLDYLQRVVDWFDRYVKGIEVGTN